MVRDEGHLDAGTAAPLPQSAATASPGSHWWSAQLTLRQRVLLHIEPILRLYRQPGTRDERHLRYDTLAVVMKVFDAIIDQSGFGSEVTSDSVAAAVRPVLQAIDNAEGEIADPALHDEVIERVMRELKNEPNRQEPFAVPYQAFDEQGRPEQRVLSFKLLIEQFGYRGDVTLRLSPEAINLFLNSFGLDVEDAQVANEAVVQAQLERGRFHEAAQSAQNARGQSLRYEAKVRWFVLQISRDIDRVDWRGEVNQLLGDALDHVQRRLRVEDDILRSAEEKLDNLPEEDPNRTALAEVSRLVKDCQRRHLQLHEQLMPARGEFLRQQARQVFTAMSIRAPIDLRDGVLRDALSLRSASAADALSRSAHTLVGPQTPALLSLKDLVLWQMMPKRAVGAGLMPLDSPELGSSSDQPENRYPPGAPERAGQLLRSLLVPTRLSSLIAEREGTSADGLELDAIVLRTLSEFGGEPDHLGVTIEPAERDALNHERHSGDDLWVLPPVREGEPNDEA